jgi:hypothetical protein
MQQSKDERTTDRRGGLGANHATGEGAECDQEQEPETDEETQPLRLLVSQ